MRQDRLESAAPPGEKLSPSSAGLVMIEPDGRVWIVEPTGHFGGYSYTFPKGRIEGGLTARHTALKETHEESGLRAEIYERLGDFVSDYTGDVTRYYVGRSTGGAPWLHGAETQAVHLVPFSAAVMLLHTMRDLAVLEAAIDWLTSREEE